MNEKANYGNWVPEKALYMLFGAVIVLGVIAVAVQVALSEMVIAIIVGVLCILTLVMAIYMLICHEAFAFGKGNMMAVVSNFVFHEVRTAKDKRDVVKEALRVLKKGGVFSFQDMFSQKALYGDMEEFVRILKEEGISEVHYIGNLEKKLDFIPGFVTTPWMISGMGIIYGKK